MNEYIGYAFTIFASIVTAATGYYFIRRKIDAETKEKNSLSGKADAETLRLYQDMVQKEALDNRELRAAIENLDKCQDMMKEKIVTLGDEIKALKELLLIKDEEIANLKRSLRITMSDNDQLRVKIEKLEASQK